MITLDIDDILSHKILAKELDATSLSAILSSIHKEYEELRESISEQEKQNYKALIEIYSNALMNSPQKNVKNTH